MVEEDAQVAPAPELEADGPAASSGDADLDASIAAIIAQTEENEAAGEHSLEPEAKGDEEPEEAPEEKAEEAPAEGTAPKPGDFDMEADEVQEAWRALRRDNWPPETIRTLTQEQLLELGAKRTEVQKKADAAIQQVNRSRSKEPNSEDQEEPSEEAQPSAKSLLDAARPIAQELALDDDAAATLAKSLGRVVETVTAPLIEKLEAAGKRAEQAEQLARQSVVAMHDSLTAAARRSLGERFPKLSDAKAFNEVSQTMLKLSQGGLHAELPLVEQVEALMESAAREHKLPELTDAERERQHEVARQKKKGSPVRTRRRAGLSDMDNEEILNAKLSRIIREGERDPDRLLTEFGGR